MEKQEETERHNQQQQQQPEEEEEEEAAAAHGDDSKSSSCDGGSRSPPKAAECRRRTSLEDDPLYARECEARQKAIKNPLFLPVINMVSTLFIFVFFLVSFEMIMSVALTVGITIFYYGKFLNDDALDARSLNLILLTFAVVSPIMALVSLAFRRRDEALYAVSDLRATLQQLYMSHALWDWGFTPGVMDESGRTRSTVNWLEHSDRALSEVLRLMQDLSRFLTLPNSTRARHRVTYFGRKEATRTNQVGFDLFDSSLVHLGKLSALCEILKREGLPPNEATRVRQVRKVSRHLWKRANRDPPVSNFLTSKNKITRPKSGKDLPRLIWRR
jgi:hypothetical protein